MDTKPDEKPVVPRWREDFPIAWERDHYVSRRELAKFLTLGSALIAGMSTAVAVVGRCFFRPRFDGPRVRVSKASAVPAGGSVLLMQVLHSVGCDAAPRHGAGRVRSGRR